MPSATAERPTSATRRPGETSAAAASYARHFEKLRRPALGMVRKAFGGAFSDDELEDIYSSAWLSTLSTLDRKPRRLAEDELSRYLMSAVANQARRELRRRGRKPTVPLQGLGERDDCSVSPDELAARKEASSVTRDVLGSLPPRRRAVLVFRYGWGLEPSEVCSLVEGLSQRAYRKEIERGVAELAEKMREVEAGQWCESREPLMRALAAGIADEEERRQAHQHLSHCRSCAGFVNELSGRLHELGSSVALTGLAELGSGDATLIERGVAVLDRGKQAAASLFNKGGDAVEQATQVAASGGGRGAGVAGAGVFAKLAGLGALPKVVAACLGTGAAATACVAAGVVPGLQAKGPEPARQPATRERPAAGHDRSDRRRHAALPAATGTPAAPDPAPSPQPTPAPADSPAPPSPDPDAEQQPPPAPAPEPPPTVQEFEPVGTPVGPATSSGGGSKGGGGAEAPSSDFGP